MNEKYTSRIEQLYALAVQLEQNSTNVSHTDDMHTNVDVSEEAYVAALEALLASVITEAPAELATLLTQLVLPSIKQARHQQLLAYYRGLALGLREQYHDALTAFSQLLAQPHLDDHVRARTLNSCAIFQRVTGQLQAAADSYLESLTLWTMLDDSLNIGKVRVNLGILAYQLQEYANAEAHYAVALEHFTTLKDPSRLASVQNELGLICRDQGRWDEALAWFDQSAAQRRAEGALHRLGILLNNRGEVLLLQGKLAEAAAVFAETLHYMVTREYVVDVHLNLGLVHLAGGELELARGEFQAALDLALALGRRDVLALVHYRLGDCLQRMGKLREAYGALEAAAAIIEATREPMTSEGLKISLLGRWQQIYEALVLLSLEMGHVADALLWAERARARAFVEIVTKGTDAENHGAENHDTERTGAARSNPMVGQSPERPTNLLVTGERIRQMQVALPVGHWVFCYFTTGVLDRSAPFLRMLSTDHPLRPYLLMPPRTLLFVITDETIAWLPCPVDPNAFTSNTQRGTDRSRFFARRILTGLSQMLLAGATAQIHPLSQCRRIYLIPHGPLHHIPFAALFDTIREQTDCFDSSTLIYAPSLTLLSNHLRANCPTVERPTATVALGYSGANQQLPYSAAEAAFVAAVSGGQLLLDSGLEDSGTAGSGLAASGLDDSERIAGEKRALLTQLVPTARWLHLACHGWFDVEAPLHSYLEIGEGERLTAQEILETWQLRAELVTLSACQSGVNHILRGDEPMGLIRALLAAGARMVLATQWPVADLPTYLLMAHFYQLLTARVQSVEREIPDPAMALAEAQQWLRRLNQAKVQTAFADFQRQSGVNSSVNKIHNLPAGELPFASPQFWAGFTLFVG